MKVDFSTAEDSFDKVSISAPISLEEKKRSNKLLCLSGISVVIKTLQECTSSFFVAIFDCLISEKLSKSLPYVRSLKIHRRPVITAHHVDNILSILCCLHSRFPWGVWWKFQIRNKDSFSSSRENKEAELNYMHRTAEAIVSGDDDIVGWLINRFYDIVIAEDDVSLKIRWLVESHMDESDDFLHTEDEIELQNLTLKSPDYLEKKKINCSTFLEADSKGLEMNSDQPFTSKSIQSSFKQEEDEIPRSFSKSALFRVLCEKMPLIEKNLPLIRSLDMKHSKLIEEISKTVLNEAKMDKVRDRRRMIEQHQSNSYQALTDQILELKKTDQHQKSLSQQRALRSAIRERQRTLVRMKKHYNDLQDEIERSERRLRLSQENLARQTFDHYARLEREFVRDENDYRKTIQKNEESDKKIRDEATKNFYRDQIILMKEEYKRQKQNLQVSEKAQENEIRQLQREIRAQIKKKLVHLHEKFLANETNSGFIDLSETFLAP